MENQTYLSNFTENSYQTDSFSVETPKAPEFKSVKGKEWVPYGDKGANNYPGKLIEYYNNSALHGAIVRSKIMQVTGNGFTWDKTDPKSDQNTLFLDNYNYDEDVNEVLAKAVNDYEIFGGFALLVTWTNNWTSIGSVKHVDFSKIRAAKVNELGEIPGYYYAFDWSTQRPKTVFIPSFNEGLAKDNKKAFEYAKKNSDIKELEKLITNETTQILVCTPYASGTFYYPLPLYVNALSSIEADIEADNYGLNSFKNGMSADYIVTMFGSFTNEQKNDEAKKFLKRHTDSNKAGIPIIGFAKDKDTAMKVDNISGNKEDKRFTVINENVMQKILSGHRVTSPMLMGIKTPGSLGGADEIATSYAIMYATVIKPDQLVVTKVFNKIQKINELPLLSIEKLNMIDNTDNLADTSQGNNTDIATTTSN